MKIKWIAVLSAVFLLFPTVPAPAADTNVVSSELQTLVGQVKTKLQAGKETAADLADELKAFDTLVAKHSSEKTDAVANVLMMKAMLYLEVLNDSEKGVETIRQVKRDFPNTTPGKRADAMIASIAKQSESNAEAKQAQAALKPGAEFPAFDEKDVTGKPLSIGKLRGKVVLIDFWATWCPPCRAEIPNVVKVYEKHHSEGFEIIGVSLDQDQQKLESFTKENKMPWQQFFDGQGWGNKLAVKYGVQSIPATYLIDSRGRIIGSDLRGDALEEAVTKALAKR
jgi:peroxiredoxin